MLKINFSWKYRDTRLWCFIRWSETANSIYTVSHTITRTPTTSATRTSSILFFVRTLGAKSVSYDSQKMCIDQTWNSNAAVSMQFSFNGHIFFFSLRVIFSRHRCWADWSIFTFQIFNIKIAFMHRFGRICISFDYFLLFLDEEENMFESKVFHLCVCCV